MTIDVRKLRKSLRLSQAEMAKRLGLDQSTVSRLEQGRRKVEGPVAILLEQIAETAPTETVE